MKTKEKSKNACKKIYYYSDPLNDDFAGTNIKTKQVGENFQFLHKSLFWRFLSFIAYYVVAFIPVWIFVRIIHGVKFKGKKNLRKVKGPKFFYGNHTQIIDVLEPSIISWPRRNKIMASPDVVSIWGIKNFVQMLGAIPVPNNIGALKKFKTAIDYDYKRGYDIYVFPEAHIWPYYTGVRPFSDVTFSYAISLNAPVFAFFTAYSPPRSIFKLFPHKTTKTIYISEPFYINTDLPRKEAKKDLRDRVYNWMLDCSKKYNTYEVIQYVQVDKKEK